MTLFWSQCQPNPEHKECYRTWLGAGSTLCWVYVLVLVYLQITYHNETYSRSTNIFLFCASIAQDLAGIILCFYLILKLAITNGIEATSRKEVCMWCLTGTFVLSAMALDCLLLLSAFGEPTERGSPLIIVTILPLLTFFVGFYVGFLIFYSHNVRDVHLVAIPFFIAVLFLPLYFLHLPHQPPLIT